MEDDFEATDMDDFEEAMDEEDFDSSRNAFSSIAAAIAIEARRFLAAIAVACNLATVEDLLEPLLEDLLKVRFGGLIVAILMVLIYIYIYIITEALLVFTIGHEN